MLFRNVVYPYECVDYWKKLSEASLPEKEDFFSHLNMAGIRVCKDFKIKNLGKYHDLCVQSDTLLLADIFNSFRNMCFEKKELDLAYFISEPVLARQATLTRDKIQVSLLTEINILLMVEKAIRGAICHAIQ